MVCNRKKIRSETEFHNVMISNNELNKHKRRHHVETVSKDELTTIHYR